MHRSSPARPGVLAAFALLGLAACQSIDAGTRTAGQVPDIETDEAGLWLVMERREAEMQRSPRLVADPALNAYVGEVMCAVSGPFCTELRIQVIDQPHFNAMMAPNGYSEVWTGLLLRAANEDQLAFVLGHEAAHFTANHSLERWRLARRSSTIALAFSIGVAAGGIPELADYSQHAAFASIFGFSRENEHEADATGLRYQAGAGYDARAGAAIWRLLEAERTASSIEAVRERGARAAIFSTHPLTSERIEALDALAAGTPMHAEAREDRHARAIAPHLHPWLYREVRRGDPGQSLFLIERLAERGHAPGVLDFHRGEIYRLRGEEGDADRALEAYERASARAEAPAETFRQLGLARRAAGDADGARAAFIAYLDRAPDAPDRALIEHYLTPAGADS